MVKGPLKALVYIASAILFFLGIIFLIQTIRPELFFVGLIFLAVGILLIILSREKKSIEIKQTVTVTGPVKVKEVRCPNCGAMVDPTKAEIIAGKPYVTCSYCNNKFELTEEPTW